MNDSVKRGGDGSGHSGEDIKGVEWLGACFDILKADLLDLGHSAKSGRNAFRVARNEDGNDYETYRSGAHAVPVGVKLRHAPSLDVQSTSDMISNSFEFREKITREFSVNGGFGSYFEFSASTTSQRTSERTGSHKELVKYCILLRKLNNVMLDIDAASDGAEIKALKRLLDPEFFGAVKALPADALDDGVSEPYRKFVQDYGTHFLRRLTLGGMAWEEVRVKADAIGSGDVTKEKIEAQASVGVGKFKAGASASEATEQARKSDAECKIERTQIKFVGGKGGLELATEFVAEVDDDPAPIMPDSEFVRLTDLLTLTFFPDDPAIARKRALLEDATAEHILTNGKGTNDCLYYSEPSTWLGVEEVVNVAKVPELSYPLLTALDHHLIVGATPGSNPMSLPHAQIVLEPAEDEGLDGQIAYFGADYPVRLRVQDPDGVRRGYLAWTGKMFYGVSVGLVEVVLVPEPDPATCNWCIELYAPKRNLDYPRALVNGDRIAVYRPVEREDRFAYLRIEPRNSSGTEVDVYNHGPAQPGGLRARVHTGPGRGQHPKQEVRSHFCFSVHLGKPGSA